MRHPLLALLFVASALVPACGEVLPLEAQACPCASGWTCCDAVCVEGACHAPSDPKDACSQSAISLGLWSVQSDPGAPAPASEEAVVGKINGALDDATPTAFDYSLSVWPLPNGFVLTGWTFRATASEATTFQVWVDEDAGALPLPLVVYGPLEGIESGSCTAALQGTGPMSGTAIAWTAPTTGTYFVAPFHAVSQTTAGLAFQGLNDTSETHAFITLGSARPD